MVEKIFGIGLNKTGTTTLASCLISLGYKHVSCRPDLLSDLRHDTLDECWRVMDENESFEDWPYPLMYKEIFLRYPNSKFILTTRASSQIWLTSLKSHSLRTNPRKHCRLLAYGVAYPHGFEKMHIDFYENHNREVLEFFRENEAEDRLLEVCWERGDGWVQLNGFLGKGNLNTVLPHENAAKNINFSEGIMNENLDGIFSQISLLYPHLGPSDLQNILDKSLLY